ncbi:MAG: response regulator, partial [Actinomycetota bacterium]
VPESVDLSVETSGAEVTISADPTQIEQVVMNLCVNSRDAMPEGGRLRVTTGVEVVEAIDADSRPGLRPGRYAALSVIDTGCGMEDETKRHIFEPFFTTKPRGEGTGLGLATVYGIVKRLEGFVYADSEPGRGTAVQVLLPVHAAEEVSVLDESNRSGGAGRGETILVVEDEPQVREVVSRILERAGYEALLASSGREALEVARAHGGRIALMLTDVVMPRMSGRELAERMHRDHPATKVVFMSGYTDDIVAKHGVLADGEMLVEKPFSAEELLGALEEALEAASPQEDVA